MIHIPACVHVCAGVYVYIPDIYHIPVPPLIYDITISMFTYIYVTLHTSDQREMPLHKCDIALALEY